MAGLPHVAPARICSYECNFCVPCTEATAVVCPSCGGSRWPGRAGRRLPDESSGHMREAPVPPLPAGTGACAGRALTPGASSPRVR
ncbi:DUF1272 domain-containing protein [Streptomyces xantholiticus]|uniref:DUF1272 domain-containing protein n=1 Tax=Streptomyces xantholiticus TaxID=68285 RepID=UPI0027E3FF39|nr:DUF1272 domain-containing protein [Streptomyces xantholiticus]